MESTIGCRAAAAHVLAIPFMIQGHLTPLLRFTIALARSGITVSFICYEDSIPRLISSTGVDESSENRSFRFVTLKKPREDVKVEDPAAGLLQLDLMLKKAFEPFMEKLTNDKSAGIPGPTCIVSDMFALFSLNVAETLQIPRYVLVPSSVTYARFAEGSLPYFEKGHFRVSETDDKMISFDWPIRIPGLPSLHYSELYGTFRTAPAVFRARAESLVKSAGYLVNSFIELEEEVVEALNKDGRKDEPKLYPVGPLFSTKALTHATNVYGLQDLSSKCLPWLDSQPPSSVLYIAFGSMVRLRPEQIEELAYGLEASNQRFLWVCPLQEIDSGESPASITDVLPPGFEARVGHRGCIVTGWVPQLEILAHSSTGGFFTHSGWNSSLEAVIFGVPMISWPQGAEQYLNSKYIVRKLKVAERLLTEPDNSVKRNEVERAVRLVMVDSEGAAIRSRAVALKSKAAGAMAEGGSQSRFFNEFLLDIRPS